MAQGFLRTDCQVIQQGNFRGEGLWKVVNVQKAILQVSS